MSPEEKVIYEGLTVCWYCGKSVMGKLVVRGEEKLNYLICDCPTDGPYEHLLGKGEVSELQIPSLQDIPKNWPIWNPKAGMMWDDENVSNRQRIPVLVFGVTLNCNSKCRICSFSQKKQTGLPSLHVDKEFINNKLSYYKGKEVILCGGEPTVREDLPELVKMIKDSGNNPVVQTNGLNFADINYLQKLKKMGLEHVHFSFDGFDDQIYEKMRGGKHEYALKLKALDNFRKENIRVSLTAVMLKGINDCQVKDILEYAAKNRHVIEAAFLCFCLTPIGIKNGFTPDNILSASQIKKLICDAVDFDCEGFNLWDEFKMSIAHSLDNLKSRFSFVPMPVFRKGMIYLKRTPAGVRPLFSADQLRRFNHSLRSKGVKGLFFDVGLKIMGIALRNMFIRRFSEDELYYRENIFKVAVVGPMDTYNFGPSSLTTFGFYSPHFEIYNKIHQR